MDCATGDGVDRTYRIKIIVIAEGDNGLKKEFLVDEIRHDIRGKEFAAWYEVIEYAKTRVDALKMPWPG